MNGLHDLAVCLSFAVSAFMVAWPLWAIDRSVSEVIARLNRELHESHVKAIINHHGISEDHFRYHLEKIRVQCELRWERDVLEDECLPLLLAAIGLSSVKAIPLEQAIKEMVECLN